MNSELSFYAKLGIVIFLILALSEVMPEVINVLLLLILAGIFLARWQSFAFLLKTLQTVTE